MIPRVLHQTWRDAEVPERWRSLQDTWRRHHPGWELRLWTDADLRRLVAEDAPELLAVYDGYDHAISRVDAARYLLLERHGGVYVDLDFEALRDVAPLLEGRALVFGAEPDSHLRLPIVTGRSTPLRRIVCNAFMASTPGHPFWAYVRARLVDHADERDPLDAAGPFFLTEAVDAWRGAPVHVAPSAQLYPLDKGTVQAGALERPGARERLARDAFAVHHWAGSWVEVFQAEDARLRAERGWGPHRVSAGSTRPI